MNAAVAPFGSTDEMIAPFASMYRWLHETWSPVGDEAALRDVASRTCGGADLALSRVALIGGVPVALALAFRDGDHADVVAESAVVDVADVTDILAATVAAVLTAAASAEVTTVEFDGHVDDAHLAPVIARMPVTSTDPLLLVELR